MYKSKRMMSYCIEVLFSSVLTGKCLASNGTCGRKGLTCEESFGGGWINNGSCCNERPCCKYLQELNYSCTFETSTPCVFLQASQDEYDWSRNSGSTPSAFTGPETAAEGNYYMYLESADNPIEGQKAALTTEASNLQAGSWCLSFQYHMRGSGVGTLEVFAGDKTSSLTSIWKKTGQQPNPELWKTATIDIPQYSNLTITIEAATGSSNLGDIAIADITLNAGTCNAGE